MPETICKMEGLIQRSGMTIYMYGTHILICRDTLYALQSNTINLDLYTNQQVIIKGSKIQGYP